MSMNLAIAERCLAELGNSIRLEIPRLMVRAGGRSLTVGEIQAKLHIPKSTLSHHLQHLVLDRLMEQTRDGRNLRCSVIYERVDALLNYLTE